MSTANPLADLFKWLFLILVLMVIFCVLAYAFGRWSQKTEGEDSPRFKILEADQPPKQKKRLED